MKKEIMIEGMTCNHCKMRVENALNNMDGVSEVQVLLDQKKAIVEVTSDVSNEMFKEVIDDAGYDVVSIN